MFPFVQIVRMVGILDLKKWLLHFTYILIYVLLINLYTYVNNVIICFLGHGTYRFITSILTSFPVSSMSLAWIESGVYGPSTVRQILKCTHYKRSL